MLSPVAAADRVEVVLSGPGDLYTRLADSLQGRLSRDAGTRGLRLTRVQAGDARADTDLSVAVGMKACEAVVNAPHIQPVLCVLVPRAGFRGLVPATNGGQLSAIYLDQPFARQFALARVLLPDARRAGLLTGPELSPEVEGIRRAARAAGFVPDLESVKDDREAAPSIRRLVTDNELILAVYESDVLTPSVAKWLLYLTYQGRIPVVGFSKAYTDAGAVASVFSTPEQIGRQAAEAVIAWLRDGNGSLGPAAYPRYYDIAVNRGVADALRIQLPPARDLEQRVARLSGGVP